MGSEQEKNAHDYEEPQGARQSDEQGLRAHASKRWFCQLANYPCPVSLGVALSFILALIFWGGFFAALIFSNKPLDAQHILVAPIALPIANSKDIFSLKMDVKNLSNLVEDLENANSNTKEQISKLLEYYSKVQQLELDLQTLKAAVSRLEQKLISIENRLSPTKGSMLRGYAAIIKEEQTKAYAEKTCPPVRNQSGSVGEDVYSAPMGNDGQATGTTEQSGPPASPFEDIEFGYLEGVPLNENELPFRIITDERLGISLPASTIIQDVKRVLASGDLSELSKHICVVNANRKYVVHKLKSNLPDSQRELNIRTYDEILNKHVANLRVFLEITDAETGETDWCIVAGTFWWPSGGITKSMPLPRIVNVSPDIIKHIHGSLDEGLFPVELRQISNVIQSQAGWAFNKVCR